MNGWAKGLERFGRRLLLRLLVALLGVRPRAVDQTLWPKGRPERILVVRLDPRLGNIILLTPLLQRLRQMFPDAVLDVVADSAALPLLAGVARVRTLHAFAKWQLFARHGIPRTIARLRRARYDLLIDAANPTSPSVTHALVARLSGAAYTVGSDADGFGRLYRHSVVPKATSEVQLRLDLAVPLQPVAHAPIPAQAPPLTVAASQPLPQASAMPQFLRERQGQAFVVLNLGARLACKQLRAADYAVIANACTVAGFAPVLSFGPTEGPLAAAVANFSASSTLAPPTGLSELAALMTASLGVISCDTGPMHLAVALGRPTCALFVSTDPNRYGHAHPPHRVVDLREAHDPSIWLAQVRAFIAGLRPGPGHNLRPTPLPDEPTPWHES